MMERKSFFKLLAGGIAGLFIPKDTKAERIEYGAQMYQRGRRDMRTELIAEYCDHCNQFMIVRSNRKP